MEELLDLRNEVVSEKTPQMVWPLLPVEYVTSISGPTDAPEVRCGLTDGQTDTHRPDYSNPRCACTPRVNNGQKDIGYLHVSFLRLVGTVYYKKHNTGFETHKPNTIPALHHHHQWIEALRQTIWDIKCNLKQRWLCTRSTLEAHMLGIAHVEPIQSIHLLIGRRWAFAWLGQWGKHDNSWQRVETLM